MPKVKIFNDNDCCSLLGTQVYIDGNQLKCVQDMNFDSRLGEVPTFTFQILSMPDIEMFGDVQFRFTPETVREAEQVLHREFLTNRENFYIVIERLLKLEMEK